MAEAHVFEDREVDQARRTHAVAIRIPRAVADQVPKIGSGRTKTNGASRTRGVIGRAGDKRGATNGDESVSATEATSWEETTSLSMAIFLEITAEEVTTRHRKPEPILVKW